jgi:hypothetical protein
VLARGASFLNPSSLAATRAPSTATASSCKKPAKKGAKGAKKQAKQSQRRSALRMTDEEYVSAAQTHMMQQQAYGWATWLLALAREDPFLAAAALDGWQLLDWLEVWIVLTHQITHLDSFVSIVTILSGACRVIRVRRIGRYGLPQI